MRLRRGATRFGLARVVVQKNQTHENVPPPSRRMTTGLFQIGLAPCRRALSAEGGCPDNEQARRKSDESQGDCAGRHRLQRNAVCRTTCETIRPMSRCTTISATSLPASGETGGGRAIRADPADQTRLCRSARRPAAHKQVKSGSPCRHCGPGGVGWNKKEGAAGARAGSPPAANVWQLPWCHLARGSKRVG